jgi:hypothetical protein
MTIYYTNGQEKQLGKWLLELRAIVTPGDYNTASPGEFLPTRDRARKLVVLLDKYKTDPHCGFAYEYSRLRPIWQRLENSLSEVGELH